ncbi:uncharacterized protein LOC116246209 isoform X2 [Nymphaea colorata]|uniref:uncharacterized protein LOC116246209 isoform X2 n=1 Tax=Nymphaea colorata TaxID=210225 RepID=UPI00129DD0B2|nr:uncharacterized protein LOC116246209 isoform X2 [Nymphaea colorata]
MGDVGGARPRRGGSPARGRCLGSRLLRGPDPNLASPAPFHRRGVRDQVPRLARALQRLRWMVRRVEEAPSCRVEEGDREVGGLHWSKIENLKAEKGDGELDNGSSPLHLSPVENVDGGESARRDRSKEGSSAGSFTQDVEEGGRDWSQDSQLPVVEAAEPEEARHNVKLELPELNEGKVGPLRKRRGGRRRKVCGGTKDVYGTGESEVLSSANDVIVKEKATETARNHEKIIKATSDDSQRKESMVSRLDWLPQFLDCVMEHKDGAVFRRRLESQRRPRYKRLIRRHIDLEMIKRSVDGKTYRTSLEMLRDLLLLLNNALVYYRKNSPENDSAVSLRQFVTKMFKEFLDKEQISGEGSVLDNSIPSPVKPQTVEKDKPETMDMGSVLLDKPMPNPVKPRSARPSKHLTAGKAAKEMRNVRKNGEDRAKLTFPAKRRAGRTAKCSDERRAKRLKGSSGTSRKR